LKKKVILKKKIEKKTKKTKKKDKREKLAKKGEENHCGLLLESRVI
jgi:hypothetical protein